MVFCGGEEKLGEGSLERALRAAGRDRPRAGAAPAWRPAADAVVDLADEPVLPPSAKLRLAALALHLGLRYEAPGLRLDPPSYEPVAFDGPRLAVIGTGKRTGKTAVAGHWAALLREQGADPVIVCMGRGGPGEPRAAEADLALEDLVAIADAGEHAASDYLEDAVLARVRTVGCRRVGGGLAGAPWESNVPAGAALAASLPGADALVFEGSGACIPPVEVDRTVCVIGPGEPEPMAEYRADAGAAAAGARRRAGAARGGALLAAPRAGRAAARGRARGAVHDGRAAVRRRGRAGDLHQPRPPRRAGRRPGARGGGRTATST